MLQVLIVVHILSAMWFAGGMVAFILLHLRLLKTQVLLDRIYYLRFALLFTKIAVVPGGLLAVLAGIMLALAERYAILSTMWLLLSLLLFIYATLMGLLYLTPNDQKVLQICQEERTKQLPGETSYRLLHRTHIIVLRAINVLAVLSLLLLMILKPLIRLP